MVNRANEVLNQNKEVEKMVKQVIGSGENISQEGRTVLGFIYVFYEVAKSSLW